MSTATQPQVVATVISVSGVAFARNADGAVRRLSAGDTILEGEFADRQEDIERPAIDEFRHRRRDHQQKKRAPKQQARRIGSGIGKDSASGSHHEILSQRAAHWARIQIVA